MRLDLFHQLSPPQLDCLPLAAEFKDSQQSSKIGTTVTGLRARRQGMLVVMPAALAMDVRFRDQPFGG
jgi:hypothetical protein